MPVSGSPRLIAAFHVLHRLLTPRHPPYALSSLTIILKSLDVTNRIRLKSASQDLTQSSNSRTARNLDSQCQIERFDLYYFDSMQIVKEQMHSVRAREDRLRGADRDRTDDLRLQSWRSPS